ncbi:GNAT family N-acetyltransferase [Clostridium oceanicum]|uniref:GNAT family N-acetyltransferase n=1 Tax=Clostridium oceanicum TaxID=1543 RepID=A0ABP3UW32_9CLOT
MIEPLKLKPVKFKSKEYYKTKELYKNAFPHKERISLRLLSLRALSKNIEYLAMYDEDRFVGFCYLIMYNNLTFIMYLAIDSSLRGKGYGGRALDSIRVFTSKNRVALNIEAEDENAENNDQRIRRKSFYIKNGYRLANMDTIEMGEAYEMLSYGGEKVAKSEYVTLLKNFATPILSPFIKYAVKFR